MDRVPEDTALGRMREDHRSLLAAVGALEVACARPARSAAFPAKAVRTLADRLAVEYSAHVAEEDGLLALLLDGPVSTRQLAQEHAELADMLDAFRRTLERPVSRERDEQLRVQAMDLVALMRAQVRKEETLVFAIAARQAARSRSAPPSKRRPPRGESS
jgi:hemerythrin-like domain-containing protein